MESIKKIPHRQHFPYTNPNFGTVKNPKNESAWKKSVYYWWWAYLKRNQKYLACCENGGRGELSSLYNDFGDVRSDNFKSWWLTGNRGANLFAEKPKEEIFRVVPFGEKVEATEGFITVVAPLGLPKEFLVTKFKDALVKSTHSGKRGYQYAKQNSLKYRINGQPNVKSLALGLEVYDYVQANPHLKLWEVGNIIPSVLKVQKIKKGDTHAEIVDKKRRLTIIVSRYLKRVEGYIENTGKGLFV